MSIYSLTNKDNVVECKWNCKCTHEHYMGTYERAVKYFAVDANEIESYGKLINIMIYHQTSEWTVRKFSNELYNLLINAQSEHRYWVPIEKRHENAMKTLIECKKIGIILDNNLLKSLEFSERKATISRIYMFHLWCKQNDY